MKIKFRWILIPLIVVGTGGVIALEMIGSAIPVEIATIETTGLSVTVSEDGHTRVRDRYVITAPASGLLARIELTPGDEVTEGGSVATLFPAPTAPRNAEVLAAEISAAEAQRDQVAAQVQELRTLLEQAQQQAERTERLAFTSSVSAAAVDNAQLAVTTAQRQLDAGKASLRVAEANLVAARAAQGDTEMIIIGSQGVSVRTPITGKVLRVLESSQRVVQAGTPLMEIADTSELEVVVAVLSDDAVRIRQDFPVIINDWGGAGTLEARVIRVEPDAFSETSALGVQEQRVNVIAQLIDPPPELGVGYGVEANIVIWSSEDALTVPTGALFQRDGEWHVFAIVDGKAALTRVEIGQRSADAAEVLGGLQRGDEVIVFPSDQIADGVSVTSQSD